MWRFSESILITLLCRYVLAAKGPTTVYIGTIFRNNQKAIPDLMVLPAVYTAIDDIKRLYNITVVINTSQNMTMECLPDLNLSRAEAFIKVFNLCQYPPFGNTKGPNPTMIYPTAILGPGCSNKILASSVASTASHMAQYTGGAQDIGHISAYPYLVRTCYNKYQQFTLLMNLFATQNWVNFSVIYDPADQDRNQDYVMFHELDLDTPNTTVAYFPMTNTSAEKIRSYLHTASEHARVFGLFVNSTRLRPILLEAANLSMTGGDYVFFTIDKFGNDALANTTGWFRINSSDNDKARQAYSVLLISRITDKSANPLYKASVAKFAAKAKGPPFSYPFPYPMNYFAETFYNAMMLIGATAWKTGAVGRDGTADPSVLVNAYRGQLVPNGMAGNFYITKDKDFREHYTLYGMTDLNAGAFTPIMTYNGTYDTYSSLSGSYVWPSSDGSWPINEPYCGFKGTAAVCQPVTPIKEIVSGIVVSMIAIAAGIGYFLYRKHKEQVEADKAWVAYYVDVKVMRPGDGPRGSLAQNALKAKKSHESGHEGEAGASTGASMGGPSMSMLAVSPSRGLWKKLPVSVRWMKKRAVVLSEKALHEVRMIQKLRNENLLSFTGACLERGHVVLLYELCSRGTLEETINSPSAKLEWPLRFSFINDIVRGMHFIHSSVIKIHGRLFSGCCFIDSRFTLKISDVGLGTFFEQNISEYWMQKRRADFYYTQLWTAPEQIREQENNPEEVIWHSSKEADTYSFSIILQEIILKMRPFGMYEDPPHKIYDLIRQHAAPGSKPFRPLIDETNCHVDLIGLCERCWSEIPSDRPTFNQIRVVVKDVVKSLGMGDRINILESLLQQMEEHTLGLQAMIEEKDKLVLEQKSRAEKLLFSNLPSMMEAAYLRGELVEPSYLDVCSVLVVEVINFNSIMASSTVDETAELFSSLLAFYTAAANKFDCFLLESLTPRVVAASGLPIRNGILHARECGRLALTLLFQAKDFPIRHLPKEKIQVRFGIHSGPIVFGIVGLHVPRFCLFGETLNIATRMMVVEEAYKIRLSAATRNIIEAFGSFRAFDSDEIFVKGNGRMKTYILVGEDGNVELMELQRKFYGGADEPGGKRKSRLV